MRSFSARIADLSPQQKALLMRRLQERKKGVSSGPIQRRPDRSNAFPLSFAQQRLWFLDRLEAGIPYNLPFALRLSGPLDAERFERCVNEIIRRHEILRTTFTEVDGQPVQLISPNLTLSIPVLDLRHLGETEREAEARRLVSGMAWQSFDLRQGPLLRCTMLRLAEREYVWMLTMHHIITDGWSIGLFVQELTGLYEAFARGESSPLAPLPLQYADFVEWQHQWLKGEILEKELSYWKEHLSGAPHLLEIPTDYPRPTVRSFRGSRHSFILSRSETGALKALAGAEEATLFMTLLTVYEVLLHHMTARDDLVIGCLIANRNHLETEKLIGFFVNQLVLRLRASGDPTFREILGRLRQATLNAFDHQELPYQWLVDAMHVERDLSRNPLFQVNFTFQNTPITALQIGDLTIEGLNSDGESLPLDVDLSLLVSESTEGLLIALRYSVDLFASSTIKRMLVQLETIIRQVIADAGVSLSRLTGSLSEAERQYAELQLQKSKTNNLGRLDGIRSRRSSAPPPFPKN
jgi:hypothetical protein